MKPRPLRFLSADYPLEDSRVVILGVPLERTVTFRGGPAQAPSAIRYASWSLESFSAISRRDLSGVGLCDLGDLDTERSLGEILGTLEEEISGLVRAGKRPVVLGGEHTVTLGCVRGAKAALGKLQLLVLDAHSDLRDEYLGERISHATVARRAGEAVDGLLIVGARSFVGPELSEPFFIPLDELPRALDKGLPVWLSLDLDVLDPSLCPGVTNPEPGGLSYHEVIGAFRALRDFEVVGLDLVELAPPFDPSGVSAITAAKLLIEAILALWG
ncbi:MAG: agmatinase family protein [Caldiserica bacterium]|nr:agmatinase family protein [Caldisericota bacterium]